MNETLADLRAQIDRLDQELVNLLARRVELSRKVSAVKTQDTPVFRPGREAQLIAHLVADAPEALKSLIPVLWRAIISSSIAQQNPHFTVATTLLASPLAHGFASGQLKVEILSDSHQTLEKLIAKKADIALVTQAELAELADRLGKDKGAVVIACLPVNEKQDNRPICWILGRDLPDQTDFDQGVFYHRKANKIELKAFSSYESDDQAQWLGICTILDPR